MKRVALDLYSVWWASTFLSVSFIASDLLELQVPSIFHVTHHTKRSWNYPKIMLHYAPVRSRLLKPFRPFQKCLFHNLYYILFILPAADATRSYIFMYYGAKIVSYKASLANVTSFKPLLSSSKMKMSDFFEATQMTLHFTASSVSTFSQW